MSDGEIFPIRLRYMRKLRKMTQEQLGNKINVTKVSISGYENGLRTPDMETLLNLANALNVKIDYLLGRSSNPELDEDQDQLWNDLERPIEEIMEKYTLVWEGQTISKEDIGEMLIYLKAKRMMIERKK